MARVNKIKQISVLIFSLGSISGSGRSVGEGNGNPLQYSCLENSMDRRTGRLLSLKLQSDTTE